MRYIPWWAKMGAKMLLSRLPLSYDFWRSLGLFRHGEMNKPQRAIDTFLSYYKHVNLPPGFVSLELGPGDSILSGLVARAYGAQQAWLLDAGHFATTDVDACKHLAQLLKQRGANPPDISDAHHLQDVLRLANIHYLTNGTKSLADIPDASVDFIWSQVVLEHVPKAELPPFFKELRRIIKPTGIGVHSIDFRDHLGGGLNNLRFSSQLWESAFFTASGFYTNRLRPREMLDLMAGAGFKIEQFGETRWPQLPLPRAKMAAEFAAYADGDFMVCEMEIKMVPV